MATYKLIASSTVGSGGASSITFSSIPGTYTDLCVLFSTRAADHDAGGGYLNQYMRFNSDSGNNYSARLLYGNGSSASSASGSSLAQIYWNYAVGDTATSNTFSNGMIYIPNYAGSNYKSVSIDSVTETNATTSIAALTAGLWNSTSAITSIQFTTQTSVNFVQYSTAYLYGISNA